MSKYESRYPSSISFNDNKDARRTLEKGMNLFLEAVAVILGPRGRNVILGKNFGELLIVNGIVNGGITIAKKIELEDHINFIEINDVALINFDEIKEVALISQSASKTNNVAGDGTTTATVLAHAIVKEGLHNVATGANPIAIKRGIDRATEYLVEKIKEHAKPVGDFKAIAQVGSIFAGNDEEVGCMIAKAMYKVGKSGVISLEEGKFTTTELEITEGMRFEKGYISPYFVTDTDRMETVFEEPLILITDKKIALVQDLVPVLEQVARQGKPLVIIAEDIEKEALATLVVNRLRGVLTVAAIKAPGFGDRRKQMLEDIAVLTGGQVISEDADLKLESVRADMLGKAHRITITKDSTTILAEGNEAEVKARCEKIRRQIEKTESDYAKEQLEERLAKLSGGVALIKVGAATETEMKDRKLRFEDAINATKAALEEGIVPGNGATFAHLAPQLEDWANKQNLANEELTGAMIVVRALPAPLKRIAENAGQNGAEVAELVKEQYFNVGYDAAKGKYTDMFEAGIVDPAKVTRSALQNAASIAGIVFTTLGLADKPKDDLAPRRLDLPKTKEHPSPNDLEEVMETDESYEKQMIESLLFSHLKGLKPFNEEILSFKVSPDLPISPLERALIQGKAIDLYIPSREEEKEALTFIEQMKDSLKEKSHPIGKYKVEIFPEDEGYRTNVPNGKLDVKRDTIVFHLGPTLCGLL